MKQNYETPTAATGILHGLSARRESGWRERHRVGTQPAVRVGLDKDEWAEVTQSELERQLRSVGYLQ